MNVLLRLACVAGLLSAACQPVEAGQDSRDETEASAAGGEAESNQGTGRTLRSLIEEADRMLARFGDEITHYSCLLIKRERIDGDLTAREYVWMKVREGRREGRDEASAEDGASGASAPFAVYLKFLKPASLAGREVLYVEGERDGDALVRKGGVLAPYVTVRVDPEGKQAKRASQYPITQSGLRYLLQELKEQMKQSVDDASCVVTEYENASFDGRPCRHIVVRHQERSPNLDFHSARVFVDEEWGLPVYYAAYGWPEDEEADPPLLEEFLFTKLTLNPGFTDKDFQADNRQYGFRRDE